MRPDEHKKKRSSAYKKKHGIGQNKAEGQGKESTKPREVVKAGVVHEDRQGGIVQEDRPSPEASAFSRKPIQSNWDRYAPLSDDEEDLGTDYNVLLSFAGDASSHIKLKHEEEWEEESAVFDVLAIDQQHLSRALANIPFCEKYKLAELGVEPDVLKYMSEIADFEFQQKANSLDAITSLSASTANDLAFNFSSVPKAEKKTLAQFTEQGSSVVTAATDKPSGESNLIQTSQSEAGVNNHLKDTSKQISLFAEESKQMVVLKESKEEDDRMVDELLSSKQNTVKNHEKEFDSAPSHSATVEVKTEITEHCEGPVQKEDGEVGDLEDWLDSIL